MICLALLFLNGGFVVHIRPQRKPGVQVRMLVLKSPVLGISFSRPEGNSARWLLGLAVPPCPSGWPELPAAVPQRPRGGEERGLQQACRQGARGTIPVWTQWLLAAAGVPPARVRPAWLRRSGLPVHLGGDNRCDDKIKDHHTKYPTQWQDGGDPEREAAGALPVPPSRRFALPAPPRLLRGAVRRCQGSGLGSQLRVARHSRSLRRSGGSSVSQTDTELRLRRRRQVSHSTSSDSELPSWLWPVPRPLSAPPLAPVSFLFGLAFWRCHRVPLTTPLAPFFGSAPPPLHPSLQSPGHGANTFNSRRQKTKQIWVQGQPGTEQVLDEEKHNSGVVVHIFNPKRQSHADLWVQSQFPEQVSG
jgi:hypothetical protein